MKLDDASAGIAVIKPGDHYCGIYSTEEEHTAVVCEFVRQGVQRDEKILYLADLHSVADMRAILEGAGIGVDALAAKGQLEILPAADVYLEDGRFDPDRMIEGVLGPAVDQALADGFSAVRATAEMTWLLGGDRGTELVIEYESRVNDFIAGSAFQAICQYCHGRFDAELVTDVLHTHPKALVGTETCDNRRHYYVPPEEFLSGDPQGAIVERWLNNLTTTARLATAGIRPSDAFVGALAPAG